MYLEKKEEKTLTKTKLRFVGTSDVSQYWWCDRQAVLKARADEERMKGSYEADLLSYTKELRISQDLYEILPIDMMEQLLSRRGAPNELNRLVALRSEDFEQYLEDTPEGPLRDGKRLEVEHRELYPTIRWEFIVSAYIVIAVPDGITDKFVYEFKTTKTDYLLRYALPPAKAQAHIYGWLFQRPNIRLQFLLKDTGELKTIEEPTDIQFAEKTFDSFLVTDRELRAPYKTKVAWKCRACSFRKEC